MFLYIDLLVQLHVSYDRKNTQEYIERMVSGISHKLKESKSVREEVKIHIHSRRPPLIKLLQLDPRRTLMISDNIVRNPLMRATGTTLRRANSRHLGLLHRRNRNSRGDEWWRESRR